MERPLRERRARVLRDLRGARDDVERFGVAELDATSSFAAHAGSRHLPAVPLASLTASPTDALTSLIGDHGLYAVFFLMLIDAVLPAASELVMLYAGALAAGASRARTSSSSAGRSTPTSGDSSRCRWPEPWLHRRVGVRLVDLLLRRSSPGRASWPLAGSRAREPRSGRALVPSGGDWLRSSGASRRCALLVVIPAGVARIRPGPVHRAHFPRLRHLVLRNRRRGLGARFALRGVPSQLPLRRHRRRRAARGGCGRWYVRRRRGLI